VDEQINDLSKDEGNEGNEETKDDGRGGAPGAPGEDPMFRMFQFCRLTGRLSYPVESSRGPL
jgi:hypothetical protein